jgi:hypothetical protein
MEFHGRTNKTVGKLSRQNSDRIKVGMLPVLGVKLNVLHVTCYLRHSGKSLDACDRGVYDGTVAVTK